MSIFCILVYLISNSDFWGIAGLLFLIFKILGKFIWIFTFGLNFILVFFLSVIYGKKLMELMNGGKSRMRFFGIWLLIEIISLFI